VPAAVGQGAGAEEATRVVGAWSAASINPARSTGRPWDSSPAR
jgi:hypothetical protein